jgi:hypothetical protein
MSIMSPDNCLRLRKTGIGVDVQYILVRRPTVLLTCDQHSHVRSVRGKRY